jgi:predicted RNA-binding Zn-ribbon protein involved in translation (DUF1610 family)
MPTIAFCPRCGVVNSDTNPDGTHICGAILDVSEHDWECHQCGWTGDEALGEREETTGMGDRILTGMCPKCGEGLIWEP